MKTTTLALATLTALGGLAALATPAVAGPDIHVSLRFGAPAPIAVCPPAPIVRYEPAPVTYYPAPVPMADFGHHHRAAGYWKEVTVKTWVPARVVSSYDRHGRPTRVIEPAHFIYTTDRIWVSNCG